MSHTDKTRPLWVQFRDPANRRFMEERHDHAKGVCDFDAWLAHVKCRPIWGSEYQCRLYHSYYGGYHNEFWPRPRKKGCWGREGKHGVLRMQWRNTRSRLLKAEDLDDVDVYGPPRREYVNWQWNRW